MAESSAASKIRTRLNIQSLQKISCKQSVTRISNALCIENLVKKNSMFAPSRLESMYFQKPVKAVYNLKLIKYKKEIEPHQGKQINSSVGKSMSSLLSDSKPEVKEARHHRNISAIWQNKKTAKQKKQDIGQSPITASFYLRKGEKPIYYDLKMDIKKVQSQIKPIEALDSKIVKGKYRNRNFQMQKQKIPSKQLLQQRNEDKTSLQIKKSLQIPYNEKNIDEIVTAKHSVPIKASTNHKERYIKSTLVSYSSKLNFKKNKQSVEIISELYHVKGILGIAALITEETIQIIEPQIIYCSNFNSNQEQISPKTANCLSVFHFNAQTHAMAPIFMKQPEKRVQIASITKVMTCLLILNIARVFRLDIRKEKALVSERASKMPGTSAGLNYSDILTVYDLLHGLMLPSGNDAAVALAEWGGKTIRKYCSIVKKYIPLRSPDTKSMNFINQFTVQKKSHQKLFIHHMNKASIALNLKNTRFANAHGLMNEKAYSTSNDVAFLTIIAMKNATFAEIVSKKQFQCKITNRTYSQTSTTYWRNTNRLLNTEGFLGVKTGVTPSAGPCLTSVFGINSVQSIIIVVLKTKSMELRFRQSLELLKQSLKVLNIGNFDSLNKKQAQDDQSTDMSNQNDKSEEANMVADQKQINSDQQNEEEQDDQCELS